MSLSQRGQKQKETGQSSMFDIFGQNVSVPLPALNLDNFDATLQEKLAWEKELMGIYFSEHPLSALASKLAEHASVLCGQITSEMAGEKVIVAGMVSAVRHASTKNNNVFVIATFEDLNGSIEVTVWSDVYTADAGPLDRRQYIHYRRYCKSQGRQRQHQLQPGEKIRA